MDAQTRLGNMVRVLAKELVDCRMSINHHKAEARQALKDNNQQEHDRHATIFSCLEETYCMIERALDTLKD